jgi:hypothetical protein
MIRVDENKNKGKIMMKSLTLLFSTFAIGIAAFGFTEKIIWLGDVLADGTPTKPISLILYHQYQIRVSGCVNLGKWIQNREKLGSDACYEFANNKAIEKTISLKNSLDISVCEGEYHSNHHYQSKPFKAAQNKIHFWVHDIDYSDNSGAFKVQIVDLES